MPVALFGWAIGCTAISGVDQLQEVGATTRPDKADAEIDASPEPDSGFEHTNDAHASSDVAASILDASEAAIAEAGLGVCSGLTMLLRLDGTLTSAQGLPPQATATPNPSFGGGKFGQGVTFTNSNTPWVSYDPVSGGTTITSSTTGTALMWVKPTGWSPPCGNGTPQNPGWAFFQVDDNGVYGDCESGGLGVWVDLDSTGSTYVGTGLGPSPTWQNNGWNHLAFAWSSAAGTLSITLNGATSQTATQAWTAPDPTPTILYVGDSARSKVAYDDVAIWTRVLSPTEIAAVYGSGKSIGDMCGLP